MMFKNAARYTELNKPAGKYVNFQIYSKVEIKSVAAKRFTVCFVLG